MNEVKIPRKREVQFFVSGLILIAIYIAYAVIASMHDRDYMPFYWPHMMLLLGIAGFIAAGATFIDNLSDLLTTICCATALGYLFAALLEILFLAGYVSSRTSVTFITICFLVAVLFQLVLKEHFRFEKLLYITAFAYLALISVLAVEYPKFTPIYLILVCVPALVVNVIRQKYGPPKPYMASIVAFSKPDFRVKSVTFWWSATLTFGGIYLALGLVTVALGWDSIFNLSWYPPEALEKLLEDGHSSPPWLPYLYSWLLLVAGMTVTSISALKIRAGKRIFRKPNTGSSVNQ